MTIEKLNAGKNPPEEVNVLIEISKGSNIKYEIDDETGMLFVDRKLFTSMFYPFNYGFIPRTKEGDGDPSDVLVLGNDPFVSNSVIRANPIGVLITEDEEGLDSKLIAVPISKIDQQFENVKDIDNIPQYVKNQIQHFFEHYKELEKDKFVKVKGWKPREEAYNKIREAIKRFDNKKLNN